MFDLCAKTAGRDDIYSHGVYPLRALAFPFLLPGKYRWSFLSRITRELGSRVTAAPDTFSFRNHFVNWTWFDVFSFFSFFFSSSRADKLNFWITVSHRWTLVFILFDVWTVVIHWYFSNISRVPVRKSTEHCLWTKCTLVDIVRRVLHCIMRISYVS